MNYILIFVLNHEILIFSQPCLPDHGAAERVLVVQRRDRIVARGTLGQALGLFFMIKILINLYLLYKMFS